MSAYKYIKKRYGLPLWPLIKKNKGWQITLESASLKIVYTRIRVNPSTESSYGVAGSKM